MDTRIADILIEALPYIRKFSGSTIVIKYGGHAMVDETLKNDFAKDMVLLKFVGINPVIVHGGGPQINRVMERMNIPTTFVRGMRMTDQQTMDVVEMVLGGQVNKAIVALINRHGGKAVGLTGKDGETILAEKMKIYRKRKDEPPEIIDPGLVGDVVSVDPLLIRTIAGKGFIPVIAPVGTGRKGETYNINADVVAARIASSLGAGRLIYLTDVDGVMDEDGNKLSSIDLKRLRRMIDDATVSGGMIPKLERAMEAIRSGVGKVAIINGKIRHSILLELFTDQGIGTEVVI